MKLVPGQLNLLALPPGQTAPFDVGALQRAGLPIAPYIEHGSWETGQPDIMFYGRDPYRGVMGMFGNYVSMSGLGNTARRAAGVNVAVVDIQRRLNQAGNNLSVNGNFGPLTRAALQSFASANGVRLPAFGAANYKRINNRTVRLPAALAAAITGAAGGKTQAFEPSGPLDPEASTDTTPAQKPSGYGTKPGDRSTRSTTTDAMRAVDQILSIAPSFAPPRRNQRATPGAPPPAVPQAPEPAEPAEAAAPNRTMLYVGVGVAVLAAVGLGVWVVRRKGKA